MLSLINAAGALRDPFGKKKIQFFHLTPDAEKDFQMD